MRRGSVASVANKGCDNGARIIVHQGNGPRFVVCAEHVLAPVVAWCGACLSPGGKNLLIDEAVEAFGGGRRVGEFNVVHDSCSC